MQRYFIDMPNLKKGEIYSIKFAFENMEALNIYYDEIANINLKFEEELTIGGSYIERKVKSGYIKLMIDENKICSKGDVIIHNDKMRVIKKSYKQKIEERLLKLCNICHIIITVKDIYWREQIYIPYEKELVVDENGFMLDRILVCSQAKLDEKGKLVILFGESSEFEPLTCKTQDINDLIKRWKRYKKEELDALCMANEIPTAQNNTKKELMDKLIKYYSEYHLNRCEKQCKDIL